MSKILEAIDLMARRGYPAGWGHPDIKRFLATGDESLLKRIPKPQDYGTWVLWDVLPIPDEWNEEASRITRLANHHGLDSIVSGWLAKFCRQSDSEPHKFEAACLTLRNEGVSDEMIYLAIAQGDIWNYRDSKPTNAGVTLLKAPDGVLAKAMQRWGADWQIAVSLASLDPDRLEKMLVGGFRFSHSPTAAFGMIAKTNPKRFGPLVFARLDQLGKSEERISVLLALNEADTNSFFETTRAEVCTYLQSDPVKDDVTGRLCAEFALKHRLPDALKLICQWLSGSYQTHAHQRELVLKEAEQSHPDMVLSMAQACARSLVPYVITLGLTWWRQHGPNEEPDAYHEAIRRLLTHADPAAVVSGVSEARAFDLSRTQNDLWPLMQHKSRPVRGAAARALAGLGYGEASEKALKLLEHKKAEVRQAAVMLLSQTAAPEALQVLKQRLDVEENDDVRDDILLALERAGSGAALSPEEQQARIAKTLSKAKTASATWIKAEALSFARRDGSALSADEVLYLLIRQSRCKEMRADLEAKPLYAALDRAASADSALALLQAFLGSPQDAADRWVMVVAALTGDDRLVPVLRKAILDWADKSRGKLAEYAAQALALLGTEAALMVVDSLSVRFRSKNKNIGQAAAEAFAAAAEARGVTVEELGDLVVPWLGFEPGKPRLIETSKGQVEARIDAELKLGFRDLKTGKAMSKLPAGASAEIQAEFKTLTATLKEAVKAQMLRIETLLVRQFRWPVARWQQLYLTHPLLRPFTQRLVWGWRDAAGELRTTFRALDDASLSDVEDNAVTLPDEGSVSLVHPLDLSDEARAAWIQHLVDYNVMPPFAQLDRPVIRCKPEEAGLKFGKQVEGSDVNAMTFRSRSEKLGWSRGSVCDGGGVTTYRKIYSGAGVEAFLGLEGMYVGIGMDETIKLGDVCFVKTGTVQVGSYTYDEPSKDDDPRLIAFADVPIVPFSETMGDLMKISGKSENTSSQASE